MKTINLRKLYFSQYHEDVFVEVSDEVAEALLLMRRAENNRRQKINYYKAYYSIDCVDGIEMAAIHGEQLSPEDYLIELAEQDEWNCMLQRLNETLASLTPTQQRRIHARYMLKMKNKDIAAMEHISPAQVSQSIRGGIKRLRQYLSRDEWADRLCISFFSCFQVCKQLIQIGIAFHGRILCNPFCFQHGSNRFLVGLIQRDIKRNTSLTERLTNKDVERGGQVHAEFSKECVGLRFQIRIHTDADVCGRASHKTISFSTDEYSICCLHEEINTLHE